ncbi:phage portal protein [Mesoterricola silvestris]|uniref:Phage portal protein n=1 Tax=Mesoterricola silvestris TaxID=2927979 RepID=A0AA48GW44_9BACT|nr:phage portal protein [Mesoterricola silvestris]BDU72916.1 phage portal protein [Mesoterricola silvestris]
MFHPVLFGPDGQKLAIQGAWKAARKDRKQTSNWNPGNGSADDDLLWDLPTLRNQSRSLQRDNPLAAGAVNTATTSVVGTGLTVQSEIDREILGLTTEDASAWQAQAERYFNLWAGSKEADVTLTQNFWEMQDLAFRSTLESGDALALIANIQRPSSICGTSIQIIEGDRIVNKDNMKDTETLIAGVAIDKVGAPSAYHVLRNHPGSTISTQKAWDIRPAFTASGRRATLHLFTRTRPGQHRGVPYLATVIEAFRELGEYTDGELRAAVISGLFSVFIEPPTTGGGGMLDVPEGEGGPNKEGELAIDYGTVVNLAPGEKPHNITPGRPNTAFDPFVLAILRQIGVGLEIPYEILIKHFTASYSAARAALLELGKFVRRRRFWLACNFCQPIYEAVIEEFIAMGILDAPGFFDNVLVRKAYLGTTWIGDSLGQIDPLKEADSWQKLVENRFATKTEATAALTGGDYERNVERLAYEEKRERDLGLKDMTATAPAAPAVYPSDAGAAVSADTTDLETP